MEDPERWKEVFQSRECRELFENNVDSGQCAKWLQLRNVISRSDLEVVEKCVTSKVACVKLLDFLVTREGCWKPLMDYFNEAYQTHVAGALQIAYQSDQLVRDNRVIYYQTPEGLPIPKQWNVPPRNHYFTGRDQLLEQLAFSLKHSHTNTVISACQGLGGVGKTQLAIEYAHRHKNDYRYIFWFMAGDSSQIETDYSRLAYLLKIDTQQPLDVIVQEVKAWLDRHPGGLLVYDNASNPEALKGYLPTMETSSIVVTSRTTQWDWLGKSFTVNVFMSDEARVYFHGLLGNLFELDAVDTLADTLGYLPLALAQAGAYMKRHKMSPSRYLVIYERDKKRLLASKFLPPDYPEPVFMTWTITMQAIQKESQLAPTLLSLCSCLHTTDIPSFLLNELANSEANNPDQEVFEEALATLAGYSMLIMNQERQSVSIHCLVQEVIRLKWTLEEMQMNLLNAIIILRDCSPHEHETAEDFIKTQHLLPHSEVLLANMDKWIVSMEETELTFLLLEIISVLTDGYKISRNDQKLGQLLERALAIKQKYYGPDHPEVATTLNNLALAYGNLGEYVKQRELVERALPIAEKHYGHDHPKVAAILTSLGVAYKNLGQYEKQRDLLERMLPITEKQYGPDHPNVASTLNILGMAYGNLGKYEKQQELLERALPIAKKHYGPDHPSVASTLNNLGMAYGDLDQYEKQQELLEQALPIDEKHYGPDHPEVATTLTNLGSAYGDLGLYDKQREVLERALPIKEKHYGPDHPSVATTLNNLGLAYGNLGQYEKQRDLLERALPIDEKHYGPDHPNVATTLNNLGSAYCKLGQYVKQRELLERALPITEKHYGPDHPSVATTLNNLGVAYRNLGQYEKQRELLERELSIYETHYGPDHPEVAATLNNLGVAYRNLGQYVKQRDLLERALTIDEKHYGPDHPEVATTLNNLGDAYGNLGQYVKQRELMERALLIDEKHYGPDHHIVATTLYNLGVACGKLGQYVKQRKLLKRALPILQQHYGPYHPLVVFTSASLYSAITLSK